MSHPARAAVGGVSGSSISAPLRPLGPAGGYEIDYRILSADGHPVSGSVHFTLALPGLGTPNTPVADPAPAPAATASTEVGIWAWVAGALAVIAGAALLARRIARA